MAMLEFLLAALLDPAQAALVLVIVLAYRGPVPVLVAAVTAAVASETITALAAADYAWGEMMAPRLLSSVAQAAVLCWAVGLVRPSRAAPPHAAGAFRPAPWPMRAFVRRRLLRLRER
jgi:hypothetical protein